MVATREMTQPQPIDEKRAEEIYGYELFKMLNEIDCLILVSRGLAIRNGDVVPASPDDVSRFPNQPGLNGLQRAKTVRLLYDRGVIPQDTLLVTTSGTTRNEFFDHKNKAGCIDGLYSYANTHLQAIFPEQEYYPMVYLQLWAGQMQDGRPNTSRETLAELAAGIQLAKSQKLSKVALFTDFIQGPRLALMLSTYGFLGNEIPHPIGSEMINKTVDMINNNPLIYLLHEYGMELIITRAQERQELENIPPEKRVGQIDMIKKAFFFIENFAKYKSLLSDPYHIQLVAKRLFENIHEKTEMDYRTVVTQQVLDSLKHNPFTLVTLEEIQFALGQNSPSPSFEELEGLCWDLAGMLDITRGVYYGNGKDPLCD